ncbi:MAG: SRPBCC domain-containing protein [Candidatus Thorarchaeota archaeon]
MTELIDAEIRQTTLVRAAPEKVYDGIASATGLNAWFTHNSEIDPRPGGDIVFRWKDWGPDKYTLDSHGKVLEAKRPEKFVFQWYADKPEYATTIEMIFEQVEEGTVIRLREYGHQNTPSGIAAMLECAAGWGEALTLLKFYVEHNILY